MKILTTSILSFALIILSCTGGGTESGTPVKLNEQQVDTRQMSMATDFAAGMMSAWNDGNFEPLEPGVATKEMTEALSPEFQKHTYENDIEPMYGKFLQLVYMETYKLGNSNIYRFQGEFQRGSTPEIRVVIDDKDRISGFWIKPWVKELR